MPNVITDQVQISWISLCRWAIDELKFIFSANMGEPLNDLEKVASGGRGALCALAVKTVLMNSGDVATMVFDEIDTGVGGVTAQKISGKNCCYFRCRPGAVYYTSAANYCLCG